MFLSCYSRPVAPKEFVFVSFIPVSTFENWLYEQKIFVVEISSLQLMELLHYLLY